MNRLAGSLMAGAMILGLSGCAGGPLGLGPECNVSVARQLLKADWDRAEVVTIRVRQNEFRPMLAEFQSGQAYILRLVNGDDSAHRFRAPDFFSNVSVAGIAEGSEEQTDICTASVYMPPGKTAEIRFVPLKDGSYEFTDAPLPAPFPDVNLGGPYGILVVN